MREMVFVLSRQKPHLVFFLFLSALSGIGFWFASGDPDPLPSWLAQAWAIALSVTGSLGLAGILWQRWNFIRGMYLARGSLMMQAGLAVVYSGLVGLYVELAEWIIVLIAAMAWAFTNLWEARLMAKDLTRLEGAGEH